MTDWYEDVLEFREKLAPERIGRDGPKITPPPACRRLIAEEAAELLAAIDAGDLIGVADGALDLIYIVLGLLVSYGIDPRPLWTEIHRSNMDKYRDESREDGKALKPSDWLPPRIEELLEKQKKDQS